VTDCHEVFSFFATLTIWRNHISGTMFEVILKGSKWKRSHSEYYTNWWTACFNFFLIACMTDCPTISVEAYIRDQQIMKVTRCTLILECVYFWSAFFVMNTTLGFVFVYWGRKSVVANLITLCRVKLFSLILHHKAVCKVGITLEPNSLTILNFIRIHWDSFVMKHAEG